MVAPLVLLAGFIGFLFGVFAGRMFLLPRNTGEHSHPWRRHAHRMVILLPDSTGVGASICFTSTRRPSGNAS